MDLEVKKSNKLTLFNPSFIDDYGFNPDEFRVFARVMRRASGEKGCSESIANMAESLKMSERIVRRAFRVLIECGAITRTERKGKTDLLDFQTCDKWKPSEMLEQIRTNIDSDFKKSERERKQKKSRPLAETQPVTPCGNATTPLAETQPPVVAETQPKGIPSEGESFKGETPADAQGAGKPQPRAVTPFALSASSGFKQDALPRSVEIYQEIYPTNTIDGDRLNMFCERLPTVNEALWRQTLNNWKLDGHKSGNLSGMIDRYEKELARKPKMVGGFIQHDTKPKGKFLH